MRTQTVAEQSHLYKVCREGGNINPPLGSGQSIHEAILSAWHNLTEDEHLVLEKPSFIPVDVYRNGELHAKDTINHGVVMKQLMDNVRRGRPDLSDQQVADFAKLRVWCRNDERQQRLEEFIAEQESKEAVQ